MAKAFNHWYHVTVHAYGSWLPGDARGWRSKNHRVHVDGDYKNPPPRGKYSNIYTAMQGRMKRDAVVIDQSLKLRVVSALIKKLESDRVEPIVAALDSRHLHILARFFDDNPKHWIGRAKKHSSHALRQEQLRTAEGGLWAANCHVKPILDRAHQVRVFRYIEAHANKGAVVWRFTPPAKPADGHPRGT
ncbi:MAG TPA: hypothetical protein VMD30_04485 [Tepidisphaeraceae bacterium]|nr:hypothetical protein [Tepidisphaeraceae bacterium]